METMPNAQRRRPFFSQPDVHIKFSTAPNYMIRSVLVFLLKSNIISKKLECKSPAVGEMCILGHFPKEHSAYRCQNGSKSDSSKPRFKHPVSISNIIEVYWWDSGGGSSDRLVARAHMARAHYQCKNRPKTEAQHPSGSSFSQGRLFHPKFYQQPIYMILLQFASNCIKKGPVTPLW